MNTNVQRVDDHSVPHTIGIIECPNQTPTHNIVKDVVGHNIDAAEWLSVCLQMLYVATSTRKMSSSLQFM